MEKSSAAKIVSQTFQNPFDKDSFVYFIKSLLNHIDPAPFVYRGNYIPDHYKPYIKTLERIGKYQDKDDKKIDLLIVHLKKEKSLERARTMQRNFIAWYLNGSRGDIMKDAALVAFVSPNSEDWRFSLVKMDYRFDASGEKVKVKQELTPARRFSFLVGITESSHTAQSSLAPILQDDDRNPTLKDLEHAFNIERVTKEFFEKYRQLFHEVKEALDEAVRKDKKIKQDFKEKNIDTINFAKKLLGQVVFLYFLQRKGWFGVERNQDWGTGPKNFLRLLFEKRVAQYNNFFNEILEPLFYEALRHDRSSDDHYFSYFNCKIPFLNGGLFDPINDYDWSKTDILLPNELFSNDEKTKQGDVGTGILDIFDRYNFTVKEDEPLEKEVAVDPEMLGKVFENLLEVKDRKSKGTYYTPREIVHYMCQQSLINYLKTETKIAEEKIERIIKQDVLLTKDEYLKWKKGKKKPKNKALVLWEEEWEVLDKALKNIKVVDPACGSGAFLVGMLQEVVRARKLLQLFNDQEEGIYTMKEEAIGSSIYGVDIDLGAVEIAKLRLWLSLIVEEENIQQIKPLPNLDYKIVLGNSLLGVEKNLLNFPLFDKLEGLKPLFFNETDAKKKKEYKKQIDELIDKMTNGHRDFDFEIYFSEVFHKKKGFDIVIANPPYISHYSKQSQKLDRKTENILRSSYTFLSGESKKLRINSVMFFLEKGYKLLNEKGVLSYIMDLNIHENPFKSIRKYIAERMKISEIINGLTAFENVGSGQVILIASRSEYKNIRDNLIKNKNNLSDKPKITKQANILESDSCAWIISENLPLLKNIEKDSSQLSELVEAHTGVAVYATEIGKAFFIKEEKCENCYPFLIGGSSIRFSYCKPIFKKYLFYKKEEENRLNNEFDEEYFRKNKSHQRPFNLRKIEEYNRPRIILRQSDIKLTATYSEKLMFGNYSLFNIYHKHNNKNLLKFILALLNSKLMTYYAKEKEIILIKPGKTPQIRSGQRGPIGIRQLPIKKIVAEKQKSFIEIVDKILATTEDEDYLQSEIKQKKVKEYEQKIDQLVYKLYGLTTEEIKIIEQNN